MANLIFAISALSTNANEKFQKMKDIIKTMVDEYGKERIHYSVIVFGEEPSVELRYATVFDTDSQLKNFLDSLGRTTSGAALDKALQKASELFEEYERDDARKVTRLHWAAIIRNIFGFFIFGSSNMIVCRSVISLWWKGGNKAFRVIIIASNASAFDLTINLIWKVDYRALLKEQ